MTSSERPVRVLVVDEEEPITQVLRIALELEGWEVTVAHSGAEAIARTAGHGSDRGADPDIVLLDMMLPDRLGTDVVAAMRDAGSRATVVFLTGRAELEQRMAAFEAGGDDYVTKPFSIEEVVDRLQGVAKRLGLAPTSRRVDDLVLDVDSRTAWRDGEYLPLTSLEFELLSELVAHRGEPRTRGQLLMATARRGIRIPVDLGATLLEALRGKVNAGRRPLVTADAAGWMIA